MHRANLAAMQALWDEVAAELAKVPTIGGQRYVDRHRRRGKMLVRDRIEALVDANTPFLELSPLAAWGTEDAIGAGVVTGIGVVEGTQIAITGSDMTYRGGSANPSTVTKVARFYEIVRQNRLPTIILNEAAGAELPRQADIFVQGGSQFRHLTQMSKEGIPSITVGFGAGDGRWRLRPGDERLHRVREGAGYGVSRGSAAGEDGYRRDRRRGDPGWGRDALPNERPIRLPGDRRDGRATNRPPDRAASSLAQAGARAHGTERRPPLRIRLSCSGVRRPTSGSPSRSARSMPGCSTGAVSRTSSRCTATS